MAGRRESSALDVLFVRVDCVSSVARLLKPAGAAFFATIALELFTGNDFFAAAVGRLAFFAAEVFFTDFEALVFDPAKFFLGVDVVILELAAFSEAAFATARATFLAAALCLAHRLRCAAAIRSFASALRPFREGASGLIVTEADLFFEPGGRPRFLAGARGELVRPNVESEALPCSLRRLRT